MDTLIVLLALGMFLGGVIGIVLVLNSIKEWLKDSHE